jgi:hypothetical protein
MHNFRGFGFMASILIIFITASCSGGGSGSAGGIGTLSLSLTDSSLEGFQAFYVTIVRAEVHLKGNDNVKKNWQQVEMPRSPLTVNLMELVGGIRLELGIAELWSGQYTQMRLIIGETADDGLNILSQKHPAANYMIDENDAIIDLKIPSGLNTGIKIVHGFTINSGQTTELILDFIASDSLVKANDKIILKPTIKVAEMPEYAIVRGNVSEENGASPIGIERALVSVQSYIENPSSGDIKDQVIVHTSTLTDELGNFSIFVFPGSYNLVVYKEGYHPDVGTINVDYGDLLENQNYTLLQAGETGTVSGSIDMPGAVCEGGDMPQYATLSFRQECDDAGSVERIEIKSLNVANCTAFAPEPLPVINSNLPCGNYQLVAHSYLRETYDETPLSITSGSDNDLGPINLPAKQP